MSLLRHLGGRASPRIGQWNRWFRICKLDLRSHLIQLSNHSGYLSGRRFPDFGRGKPGQGDPWGWSFGDDGVERSIVGKIGDYGEAYKDVPTARDDPTVSFTCVDTGRVGEYAGDSGDGERAHSSIVSNMVATYCSGVRTGEVGQASASGVTTDRTSTGRGFG